MLQPFGKTGGFSVCVLFVICIASLAPAQTVDAGVLLRFVESVGAASPSETYQKNADLDLSGNGVIDVTDLLWLARNWQGALPVPATSTPVPPTDTPAGPTSTPVGTAIIRGEITSGDPCGQFELTVSLANNTLGVIGTYAVLLTVPAGIEFVSVRDADFGEEPTTNQVPGGRAFSTFSATTQLQNGALFVVTLNNVTGASGTLVLSDYGQTPLYTQLFQPVPHGFENPSVTCGTPRPTDTATPVPPTRTPTPTDTAIAATDTPTVVPPTASPTATATQGTQASVGLLIGGDPCILSETFTVSVVLTGNTVGIVGTYAVQIVLQNGLTFVGAADGEFGVEPTSNVIGGKAVLSAFSATSQLQNGVLCVAAFRNDGFATPTDLIIQDYGFTPLYTLTFQEIPHVFVPARIECEARVTDTPTAVPTAAPTDTPAMALINIEEYFPLALDSQWNYVEFQGASPEDDFRWDIFADPALARRDITVGGQNVEVTLIHTTTVEPTDDLNGYDFFWRLDANGVLRLHGFRVNLAVGNMPVGDYIFSKGLKVGEREMTVGTTINDSATTTVQTIFGPVTVAINSRITYEAPVDVPAPLGLFRNTCPLRIDLTVNLPIVGTRDILNNRFYLARNVGMVRQTQKPDTNDAEDQVLASGKVGGVPIQAQ